MAGRFLLAALCAFASFALAVAQLDSATQGFTEQVMSQGFTEQVMFVSSATCAAKPTAYITTAWGICVKNFGGPQDPTTELTSFLLLAQEGSGEQLSLAKSFFADSQCSVPSGQQRVALLKNDCFALPPNGMQYTNATTGADMPEPAVSGGVAVVGYNEYGSCSNARHATYRVIYPNDACIPQKGQAYASFSLACTGQVMTQTFFSDSACTQASTDSAVSHKLGGPDSTCYTNQDATTDINLFETMRCVGQPATR